MNKIVHNTPTSNNLVKFYPDGSASICLDNILIENKRIIPGNLYLKVENGHYSIIRIIRIWQKDNLVFIKVKEQDYDDVKKYLLSHILDPENKFFLWYLLDYEQVMNLLEDRVIMSLIVGKTTTNEMLLDFEF